MWVERLVLSLWSSMLMELSDPDLKMTKGAKIKLLRCLSTFTHMFFPALLQKKKKKENPSSRTENYEL